MLRVTESHSGNFVQGQQGAVYTVMVSDGTTAAPTSGAVTVTEQLPAGLTLVSMSGIGWLCSPGVCSRSDVLGPGASYPAITITVNVASNAPTAVANSVLATGGGSPAAYTTDYIRVSRPRLRLRPR